MNIFVNDIFEILSLFNEYPNNHFISQVCKTSFDQILPICDSCARDIVSKKPQVSTRCRYV